jgi:hypothetical protein
LKLYTLARAQKLCGNQGEFNMPKGKGTYGTTVGRPPKKKVVKKPKKKGSY